MVATRSRFLFFLILFVAEPRGEALALPPVQQDPSAWEHFQRGRRLQQDGQLEEARRELSMALEIQPDFLDLYPALVEVMDGLGDPEGAFEVLKRGSQRLPRKSAIWFWLGARYLQRGEPDSAIHCYRRATRLAPENADYRRELGRTYIQKGLQEYRRKNYLESLVLGRRASKIVGESADAHHLIGISSLALHPLTDAEASLQRALGLKSHPAYYYDLALVHLKQEHFLEAETLLEKEIEPSQKFPMAHLLLGRTYHNLNRTTSAIREFQKALVLDPSLNSAHYHLGYAYKSLGQDALAVAEIEKEISNHPDSVLARLELGELYLRAGDRERATQQLEKALREQPNNARALYLLAKAFHQWGRNQEALQSAQQAVTIAPEMTESYYLMAPIYLSFGETDLAERQLATYRKLKAP